MSEPSTSPPPERQFETGTTTPAQHYTRPGHTGPAGDPLASFETGGLTLRAVLTGMVLGALLSTCNIYIGLKLGSAPGMSLVAALLGFGFWGTLHAISANAVGRWGILENNINQTACSAGASVASAGLVAPIPALTLLTGTTLPWHSLALWVFSVMLVGIVVAVALRRQMIIVDKLRFPAGIASAEMLREIHAYGSRAFTKLIGLASAALVAAGAAICATFGYIVPYVLPFSIKGISARSLTLALDPNLLPVGIGGLIGFRACCSLLVGAILAYGVLAPSLIHSNYIRPLVSEKLPALPNGVEFPPTYSRYASYDDTRQTLCWSGVMTEAQRDQLLTLSGDSAYQEAVASLYVQSQAPQPSYSNDIRPWLLWPGVTLMVVASLASLGFSWRSIFAIFSGRRRPGHEELAEPVESRVPRHWFLLGLGGVLVLSVVLQVQLFGIVWWAAIAAVLLAFGLAVVAARVTGETGIGSVGAMGKVSQLAFGFLVPKNPVPNLMAANVAGGAASQCADLLDDLKCGHLLGASPRSQTFAQICGALAGALVGSAAYLLLIPEPGKMLLTGEWPAPAAAVWKAVAELLKDGFAALPPGTATGMALAAVAAVLLTVLERVAPGKLRPFILSPVSIGLAFVIPAHFSLSIFAGGLLVLVLGLWLKDWSKRYLVAICVGLIAGESFAGLGLAIERALSS